MKHLIIIAIMLGLATPLLAVENMVLTIPESMFPYITAQEFKDIVGMKDIEKDSIPSIPIKLGTLSMPRLTDDVAELQMADNFTFEIGKLQDNLYVVIKTIGGPEKESVCGLYDAGWKKVQDLSFDDANLICKPDTMDQDTYEEYLKLIEFPLVEVHLSDAKELTLSLNPPMLSVEDKKKVEKILLQRKLKWNGKTFN